MSLNQHPNWIAAACSRSELTALAMQDRSVLAQKSVPLGRSDPSAELQALAADWQINPGTTAILCGIVDAVPVSVPTKPLDLSPVASRSTSHLNTYILPGLSQDRPPALMGRSATTIAGFLSLNPTWDGVLCIVRDQTHWVLISAGEVVSFQSFLTIPSYDALSRLPQLGLPASSPSADEDLCDAVDDAMAKPERLAARIAELSAGRAIQGLSETTIRSRLLGTLIGAELATARPYWLGQNIALLGDGPFQKPYARALERLGTPVTLADSQRMTLEGLIQGWKRLTGAD